MTEFRYLDPQDVDTASRIIELSDQILLANPTISDIHKPFAGGVDQDKLGTSGYCLESSDAVTRASHALGIVAARELLVGWHFITYFSPLNRMPDKDDLVMCRTWGQYDNALYSSNHPLAGKPFLGRRRDLAALLPGSQGRFEPDAVTYRMLTHEAGSSPELRHIWLATEPEELVSKDFTLGRSDLPTANDDSCWL